ncbi:MAG: LytTR family DNA-binding domain-containing protein [Gelidibacter sp.]
MKTLKALIIEDNSFMANILQDMLQQYNTDIVVDSVAKTGKEALYKINQIQPDVVFLDIELPDMNGFELLSQLKHINFKIIFTTSHSNYAIKAFRFNALDYLVKPINTIELNEAVERLLFTKTNYDHIQTALKNFKTNSINEQRLVLYTQKGYLKVPLKQIIFIESERNYSYIHLTNGSKTLLSKTLAYFDELLCDKAFFRCHRSFLVNKLHVKNFKETHFMVTNDIEIPISRRKKMEVKQWYKN